MENLNHADCDGNGVINDDDTLAIYQNYGATHNKNQTSTNNKSAPYISLSSNKSTYILGDTVKLDVIIGNGNMLIDEIYGLAYSVNFDNSKIKTGSVQFHYENNFLGKISESLKLTKVFENSGTIETAYTRKNQRDTSGYGKIGELSFIINESISSLGYTDISISNYKAVKVNGQEVLLNTESYSIYVNEDYTNIQQINKETKIQVFPNPVTSDQKFFALLNLPIEAYVNIKLYDLSGKIFYNKEIGLLYSGINTIEISPQNYLPGLKILEVEIGHNSHYYKINVIK